MSTQSAWEKMNSDTKRYVVETYAQYQRSGSQDVLRELKKIFENHGDDAPSEREIGSIIRR